MLLHSACRVFAQYIEAKCSANNEDAVGVAPTGDGLTTSEWLAISLHTQARLILETWRYIVMVYAHGGKKDVGNNDS